MTNAAAGSGGISLASLASLMILRELDSVRESVKAYPDDDSIWRPLPGITNLGGTLVLHIAGNLRHFIGSVLGAPGYIRDRDAEFSSRGVPRSELLAQLDAARSEVERTLAAIPQSRLVEDFPLPIAGRIVHTGDFLVHLASHLAYHLGQLDYHRRIVTGQEAKAVAALQLAALPGRSA